MGCYAAVEADTTLEVSIFCIKQFPSNRFRQMLADLRSTFNPAWLLFGLEVVEKDATFLRFLAPIADDYAGAVHNLTWIALTIDVAFL